MNKLTEIILIGLVAVMVVLMYGVIGAIAYGGVICAGWLIFSWIWD